MFRSLLSARQSSCSVRRIRPALEQLEDRTVPTAGWAINAGANAQDVAADADGNVYVTGHLEGTLDFDPSPLVFSLTSASTANGYNAYVASYAPDGTFRWAQQMVGAQDSLGRTIHVSGGKVVVGGEFGGSATIGTVNLTANAFDGFVAWLDATDGTCLRADRFGGGDVDYVRHLDAAPDGGVFVGGMFRGTVDFDPGPGTATLTTADSQDSFVLRLDSDGDFVWAQQIGGSDPEGLGSDALGNSYLAGNGSITALDANGHVVWTKATPTITATDSVVSRLAVDDQDANPANWVVYYSGSANDGGDRILKLKAADGATIWDKVFARTTYGNIDAISTPQVSGVAVAPGGNVYVTGRILTNRANIDFDPGPGIAAISAASDDVFLLGLDAGGNYVSGRRVDGPASDIGSSVNVGNDGTVYHTGQFDYNDKLATTSFDVGDGDVSLNSANGNGFLVKLVTTHGGISGRVFHDGNGNVQDDEGFALQGWTVYLDANTNSQLDAGEQTSVTDARGQYSFPHLLPGTYTVAQVPREGWWLTTPGSATVTVAGGQIVQQPFGNATTTTVRTYASANVPVTTVNGSSTLTITDTLNILDLDLRVSVTHTKVQDLTMWLTGPDGKRVRLLTSYSTGITGKNLTNTIFDLDAPLLIGAGTAPYTGHFRPVDAPVVGGEQPSLAWWDGQLTAGTWTLSLTDSTASSATGTLTDWALLITTKSEPLPPPSISVSDASITEGPTGTQSATFTVSMSNASTQSVTVGYTTADGTATTADNDYAALNGVIAFLPGQTTATISVPINGDTTPEANETFLVNLSNPTNATLGDAQGVGTILDDDSTKFFVVNDGSPDQTYRYGTSGNAQGSSSLTTGNTAPRGAASNSAGTTLWILDVNKTVYVYNSSGSLLGSWTAGGLASGAQVEGLATNGTDVWIVDAKQDKVFRYTGAASRTSGSQNAASSFSLASGNGNPTGIVTDGASLWVVNDAANTKVFKYNMSGTLLGSWTADGANATPTGITLDPSNPQHLWIVDSGTDRVYQYDNAVSRTSGSQNANPISFALAAGNTNPQDIADPPVPALQSEACSFPVPAGGSPAGAQGVGLNSETRGGSRRRRLHLRRKLQARLGHGDALDLMRGAAPGSP